MAKRTREGKATRKKVIKNLMSWGIPRNQAYLICVFGAYDVDVDKPPFFKREAAWRSMVLHPKFLTVYKGR